MRLYSTHKVIVPPRSIVFIPLKAKEGEKFDPGRDIVVIADGTFQKKNNLLTNPIGIAERDNPVIAAINLFDTSVST